GRYQTTGPAAGASTTRASWAMTPPGGTGAGLKRSEKDQGKPARPAWMTGHSVSAARVDPGPRATSARSRAARWRVLIMPIRQGCSALDYESGMDLVNVHAHPEQAAGAHHLTPADRATTERRHRRSAAQ